MHRLCSIVALILTQGKHRSIATATQTTLSQWLERYCHLAQSQPDPRRPRRHPQLMGCISISHLITPSPPFQITSIEPLKPQLALARSPETKTTRTAEYAAVAAKIASRFALVEMLSPRAKVRINTMTSASRAFGLVTKYRTMIGQVKRSDAMATLRNVTSHPRRRSSNCRNSSQPCVDNR